MTFNNIPKNLVDDLCACMDRIEVAIRTDEAAKERARIADLFRAEFPDQPVAKPKPDTLYPITDMHGHPLHETGPQPNHREQAMSDKHYQLVRWLSSGTFFAVPTLAGHLGIKKQSVYAYLNVLKKHGYEIEKRSTGNLKGGYRNIYRLAMRA